jgi:DNA-binding LacI/PurR family transcriptional regulator/signal transduction histidine kinase
MGWTIGLLTTGFAEGLERALFVGAAEAAEELGVNLTMVAGGRLNSPLGYEARANILYDLVSRERIDGFVIRAGAIGLFSGLDPMKELLLHFDLPIVTIGASIAGIPRVLVDSYGAMFAATSHLIEAHGIRKIAFVSGPPGHQEGDERYRAYVDALVHHGIDPDPRLVLRGNFSMESGVAAADLLLSGDVEARAIVASNDEEAIGVLSALERRDVDVPGRMAVVGFDDIEPSAFVSPPLTTVRMDLADVGKRATELLVRRLRGEEIDETTTVDLPLVIRRSCGCLPLGPAPRERSTVPPPGSAGRPERLVRELTRWMEERPGSRATSAKNWPVRIASAFRADLGEESSVRFATAWDEVLRRFPAVSVEHLSDLASIFHREALPLAASDPDAWRRAQELTEQAIILVADAAGQRKAWEERQHQQQALRLQALGETLIATFDLDKVMDQLAQELPRLGIRRCYLALYEGDEAPSEWSRLLLAYDERRRVALEKGGRRFRSKLLVPSDLLSTERQTIAVYALYFQDHQQGFIVFDVTGPEQGVVCSAVRGQVSTVIRGALLVRQLESRARELERAYEVQKEQQTKLLVSEKMASLGRLTAGIAHELNTPLAAVRTSLTELESLVAEYERAFEQVQAEPVDHRQIAGEMGEALSLGKRAAERAVNFVRGIKAQTRGLDPEAPVPFDAVAALRETLLLLGYTMREGRCEAVFEPGAESILVRGSPARLAQVVTNLVRNSVEALAPRGGGRIELSLREEGDGVVLEVTDKGGGIPAAVLPKIFDPMFTTKPFGEATGLGLTIVHHAVTGEFGGTIDVESHEGAGTTVRIRFPKVSGESGGPTSSAETR